MNWNLCPPAPPHPVIPFSQNTTALAWQPEVSPVHTNLPLVYKQGVSELYPLVYFCSVSTHQVFICKFPLPLFCCWVSCIHPVWGNETRTHVKNQSAKILLDGDHNHAAFTSLSLHHVPMSLCPFVLVSVTSYLYYPTIISSLSIQSFSHPPFIEIPWILLDFGLCC